MKMTSAYANKMIKKLEEDKRLLLETEANSSFYTVAEGETPLVPQYNYKDCSQKQAEIDDKISVIKHAINISNVTSKVPINGVDYTVDTILTKMTMLNRRKSILADMRSSQPKERMQGTYRMGRNLIEYRYANFSIEEVRKDYDAISKQIMDFQMALDKHNQTTEFDVEIEL